MPAPGGDTVRTSDRLDPRLLRIAAVVVLGTFMSILDTTIINVALRTLSRTFYVPLATTQWVSTGYMLALATVIPLTGWASDRFGTKRLYIISIGLFLAGSALSGAAWSMGTLILFRVLQGLGGGMIMPTGMTILSHAAGPGRMGRLMGIVGVPMLLGPIFGAVLGGWLVDDVSWRWIFFVNLPVGVIALVAAARVLDADRSRPSEALDWLGLLLLSPGLAIFVYGLARIAAAGNVDSLASDLCLLGGLAMVGTFVGHAWRRRSALIDVRLFGRRTVGAAAVTTFLFAAAFFGTALLLPLYFQVVRGQSAFGAGLLIAAQGVGAMVSMPVSSRVTDKAGPGRVVLVGLFLYAIAMWRLSQIGRAMPLWHIEATLFLAGVGAGAVTMPATSAALSTLQRHEIARATSGLNVVQRVGGSVGTALLAVVLSQQMSHVSLDRGRSNPAATAAASDAALAHPAALPGLARAFGQTFCWPFGVVVLALGAALFLPRRQANAMIAESAAPVLLD